MRKVVLSIASVAFGLMLFGANTVAAQSYGYTYDYDYDRLINGSAGAAATGVALGTTSLIVICCSLILAFAVNFAIAWFVYKDAKKHKIDNAMLWSIICFFFTLLGLIVYLAAIRPDAIRAAEGKSSSEDKK